MDAGVVYSGREAIHLVPSLSSAASTALHSFTSLINMPVGISLPTWQCAGVLLGENALSPTY